MDQEKLKYDLAMVYAKTKLEDYLKTDHSKEAKSKGVPEWQLEVDELQDAFIHAYGQFNSWSADMIINLIRSQG